MSERSKFNANIAACVRWSLFTVTLAASALTAKAQNQILGAGYSAPWVQVAPGQILTLFTPALNVPDAIASGSPVPNARPPDLRETDLTRSRGVTAQAGIGS